MSRAQPAPTPNGRSWRHWQIALAASGWVLLAMTTLPTGSAWREVTAFGFLLSCPGAALVRHWPAADRLERLVVAIATSMALTILVAEGLILVGAWSARLALGILAVVTSVGALSPVASPASQGRDRRRELN